MILPNKNIFYKNIVFEDKKANKNVNKKLNKVVSKKWYKTKAKLSVRLQKKYK
jgi:hypothetical protein